MEARSFLCALVAVGCLGGYGSALPPYTTITREHRALRSPSNAATPIDTDTRQGRTLILETLSALAGKKISKLLNTNAYSTSSTSNSLNNWFTNPFNVTLSLGVVNSSNASPVYNPTPIYNAFPITNVNTGVATGINTGINTGLAITAYRGEMCNANAWPVCSTGATPCNDNLLPACYFAWPACNSNVLPACAAVLAGVACNNNSLPYCADVGVPCNANDFNFCINAPSPCNDNNWPYCPGYGALAASFDGVVNGVVNGGVNGVTGPNGAFFSPNAVANVNSGVNSPFFTGTALTNVANLGVNGAFFSPAAKKGGNNAFLGNAVKGNNGALFVKNSLLAANAADAAPSGGAFKPDGVDLGVGLLDAISSANSTPPWTFELTRPASSSSSHRQPKPLDAQKYMVAIAPMVPPTLGTEALSALGDDYDDYGQDPEDGGFGLQLFGEKSDKLGRGPRKPHRGVRVRNKTALTGSETRRRPFRGKGDRVKAVDSKHAGVKAPDPRLPNALVGLPGKYHELAKISKVTFGANVPSQRSL